MSATLSGWHITIRNCYLGGNCSPHCKDERKALYMDKFFLCCHSFLATALKDYCHTETGFVRSLQTRVKRMDSVLVVYVFFVFIFHFRKH
jgi:hypothetical protein